ncbi:hypothetical protein BCR44DRAFT_1430012 [Catenaria anguillulae PL171]|uniref:Uncharacterized protein n=1 Tax=Catenaria anguillulae PL171 TaxID=765915 RepID=A0A1Y2HVW3_9FUNG|nr:hypothetical protein BCR44DRAFT_1430012 [Catenaria anguillulae PL171]
MTNAYHALHTYLLSVFRSSSPATSADPATVLQTLSDLFAFTITHALPAIAAFVGTLVSVLTDPDRLMLWLDFDYVRDHMATIAAIVMALVLVWVAWQAVWAVHRIMRVLVGMAVKLVVAGVLLAVVWNVYNSAAGGSQTYPASSSQPVGEYAYSQVGNQGARGFMDQVFSAAKTWSMHQSEQHRASGEYSYKWAGGKYRNRREADMDNGL